MSPEKRPRNYRVNDVVNVVSRYLDLKVPIVPLIETTKFHLKKGINTIKRISAPESKKHENFFGSYGFIYVMDKNGVPIVLLNREKGADTEFNLPGGTRKKNESPEQTYLREINEEVGLRLEQKDIDHVGEVEWAHPNPLNLFIFEMKNIDQLHLEKPSENMEIGLIPLPILLEIMKDRVEFVAQIKELFAKRGVTIK